MPATIQALTGAAFPLSSSGPASVSSATSATLSAVVSPTSTPPGGAAVWNRAEVFTVSPVMRQSSGPLPMLATTSPVLTPTRRRSAASSRPSRGPSCSTAATSASPARTARSASSSRARGMPKTAITASPMNFSTRPP